MRQAGRDVGAVGRAALAATLGFACTTANASQPPAAQPDAQDAIVVTGTPLTRQEIRRRAVEFVRGTGVANGQTPAARWADPVCPSVLGISRPYADRVEGRMRAIAEAAGIAVAAAPCRVNIVVSFAFDGAALARTVAARQPSRLGDVRGGAREALLEGEAPVRWWYASDVRTRHNMVGRPLPPGGAQSGGEGGGPPIPVWIPTYQHYDSSLISTQIGRVLTAATVIVDLDLAEGVPLDSVAAYAAMVAFAEIDALDAAPAGSILGLFRETGAARELSEQDMVFLRTLYRLPLDRQARRHRGILVRELVAAQSDHLPGEEAPQ